MKSLPGSVFEIEENSAGNSTRNSRIFDILKQFPQLEQLYKFLRASGSLEALAVSKPLRVRELAMLEAELRNQGLLTATAPGIAGCFAHRASLDASTWRWRARRMRVKEIPVLVDVPRYLIAWSEELIASLASLAAHDILLDDVAVQDESFTTVADKRDVLAKLTYLNQLAAYLLGLSRSDTIPFGRGFQALLRILSTGALVHEGQVLSEKLETLTLPATKTEFNQILRAVLDRPAQK